MFNIDILAWFRKKPANLDATANELNALLRLFQGARREELRGERWSAKNRESQTIISLLSIEYGNQRIFSGVPFPTAAEHLGSQLVKRIHRAHRDNYLITCHLRGYREGGSGMYSVLLCRENSKWLKALSWMVWQPNSPPTEVIRYVDPLDIQFVGVAHHLVR